MSSQDATQTVEYMATAAVHEFVRQEREHNETPELIPAPAIDDIVFYAAAAAELDERAVQRAVVRWLVALGRQDVLDAWM